MVSLAGFNNDEYREAAQVYGISTSIDRPILHMPLVLSLCSRYQLGEVRSPDALISLNKAIEAYVEEAARNLAVKGPGPPLSTQVMRSRLISTAALMWERDVDVVDITSFDDIFGTTIIIDNLVSEGVMTATPSGYRFVYDDVSDWLQAQALDLDSELAAIVTSKSSSRGRAALIDRDQELSEFAQQPDISWRKIGPVSVALRDIEDHEGAQALAGRLQQLVEETAVDGPAFELAKITLAKIGDPQNYAHVLEGMAHRIVSYLSSAGAQDPAQTDAIEVFADDFWITIPLPIGRRIRLLRKFIPFEDDYPWRPRDWSSWRLSNQSFSWRQSFFVARAVAQDPDPGLAELVSWLDDDTPLDGGEASVADVAMGILYHLRKSLAPAIWLILTKSMEKCDPLIKRLAEDDPHWLADMISNQVPVAGDEVLIVYGAAQLAGSESLSAEEHQAVRQVVARRYAAGLSSPALGWALNVLTRDPAAMRQFADQLVQGYRDEIPGINAYTLVRAVEDGAADLVLPALIAGLDPGGRRRGHVLIAMAKSASATIQATADRVVLRQLEDRTAAVDLDICRYAEERLYRNAQASGDLLAIVRHIISAPPDSGRSTLAYPLAGPNGLRDMTQRRTLLAEFLEATPDTRAQAEVVRMLARSAVGNPTFGDKKLPGAFDLLQLALARIDPGMADYLLFRQAFRESEFANLLAQWLATGMLTPPGDMTRQLMAYVKSGKDPKSAANQVMQDQISGHG